MSEKNIYDFSFLREGLKIIFSRLFGSRKVSYVIHMIKTNSGQVQAFACDPRLCLALQTLARIEIKTMARTIKGFFERVNLCRCEHSF